MKSSEDIAQGHISGVFGELPTKNALICQMLDAEAKQLEVADANDMTCHYYKLVYYWFSAINYKIYKSLIAVYYHNLLYNIVAEIGGGTSGKPYKFRM